MGRPRVVFVHGSVVNGEGTWAAQRPLAGRFELVVPNRRGFPPGPDVERVDFEDEAVWLDPFLEPGTPVKVVAVEGMRVVVRSV